MYTLIMSNNVEIEAKALLTKEEYEKLMGVYSDYHAYIQTNYYIDSPNRILKKNDLSLRVRAKEGKHELTMKSDLEEGRLERNVYITTDEFEDIKKGIFPDNEIKDVILEKGIDLKTLKILTSLETKRIDVLIQGGLASIDENHYGDKVDYEIELEHESMEKAITHLKELLEKNEIEYRENTVSKTSRALAGIK